MAKLIPLGGRTVVGLFATVDDDTYERLVRYCWRLKWGNGYDKPATAVVRSLPRGGMAYMAREITGAPNGLDVDHRDHDILNNQASNLRVCTRATNLQNRRAYSGSGFKGVYARGRKWRAGIGHLGRLIHIGVFQTKEDAARAYDKAALELYGAGALTNFQGD